MAKRKEEPDEDYGDYVTRCICDLSHDDGYMIACDDCGVWQHIECMQVDPKNLPENYLCEECEPRAVDRRRARQIQIKKRDALSELDSRAAPPTSLLATTPLTGKKKRKKGRVPEPQRTNSETSKRSKKETPPVVGSNKKPKKRRSSKPQPRSRLNSSTGSIQSLLNAASLLEGEGGGVWSSAHSPWSSAYQTIDQSSTSAGAGRAIAQRLSMLKSEAVVFTQAQYQSAKCNDNQCSVAEVARQRKGLVADVSIPEDELVIEYKGVVSLKNDLLSELGTRLLWKQSPCPFVYQYDKMGDFQLCIDARNHGNQARFIRRSCCPNSEVRHFFLEDTLLFGVYALSELSPREEVTLAFDFPPDKCDYPVECACGQPKNDCSVSNKHRPRPNDEEAVGGRGKVPAHLMDEDSNSSWASTGSGRRRRSHKATPLSPKTPARDSSSDSDSEKRRKSLTREERKTEQVWKMFEKMEATQRRRAQLASEGSADSADPITSPLHTRHMIREKKTPAGSRKAQLLASSNKMRLSSVSSGDPLSPTDLPEPFSPPTPQAPPPGHAHLFPTVDPSPSLHPKYLLEEFVLPLKKALLRKWEAESQGGGVVEDYWYWANSAHCPSCWPENSPRVRGSLKHRWLRQLVEEGLLSEGLETPPCKPRPLGSLSLFHCPVPHKKLFLQRWLDASHAHPQDSPLFSDWSDGEDFDEFGKKSGRVRNRDSSITEHDPSPPVNQSDSLQESHDSICSDISEVSMTKGPKTPPTQEESPIHSPAAVDISDISSDSNVMEPHPPGLGAEHMDTDHMTQPSDHMTQPLSPKTPIKRKINLSEYRNRARKPADRKSSAETTPPQPPPQFEPVSPDERDATPPLAEGTPPVSSHMIPPPPPSGGMFQPHPPAVWAGLPAEAHDPRIGHMMLPGVLHEPRPPLHHGFMVPGMGYHMTRGPHPHTSSSYIPPRPPGHYYQ